MQREQILELLRTHEADLNQAGILHLRLFGSRARDDWHPKSDIDLLAVFDDRLRLSALDLVRLEQKLGDLLGYAVDLSEEGTCATIAGYS